MYDMSEESEGLIYPKTRSINLVETFASFSGEGTIMLAD